MAVDWSNNLSPLEAAREATMDGVRRGDVPAYCVDSINGPGIQRRLIAAADRRAAFTVIDGGIRLRRPGAAPPV